MERKFERGDIVILTNADYLNIKKGTVGVVVEPRTQYKILVTIHIDGGVWSFREDEFDLVA